MGLVAVGEEDDTHRASASRSVDCDSGADLAGREAQGTGVERDDLCTGRSDAHAVIAGCYRQVIRYGFERNVSESRGGRGEVSRRRGDVDIYRTSDGEACTMRTFTWPEDVTIEMDNLCWQTEARNEQFRPRNFRANTVESASRTSSVE